MPAGVGDASGFVPQESQQQTSHGGESCRTAGCMQRCSRICENSHPLVQARSDAATCRRICLHKWLGWCVAACQRYTKPMMGRPWPAHLGNVAVQKAQLLPDAVRLRLLPLPHEVQEAEQDLVVLRLPAGLVVALARPVCTEIGMTSLFCHCPLPNSPGAVCRSADFTPDMQQAVQQITHSQALCSSIGRPA